MEKLIDGLKFGLGFVLVVGIFVFGLYLVKGWNGLQATDGDQLTAQKWNELVGSANGAPSGFVGAFNLTTCPTGRKPSDGTDGTPDLRGSFIRGINGHLNSRDIERQLASYQEDTLQNITGQIKIAGLNGGLDGTFGAFYINGGDGKFWNTTSSNHAGVGVGGFDASRVARTSNETRSKNIALLYCIKE